MLQLTSMSDAEPQVDLIAVAVNNLCSLFPEVNQELLRVGLVDFARALAPNAVASILALREVDMPSDSSAPTDTDQIDATSNEALTNEREALVKQICDSPDIFSVVSAVTEGGQSKYGETGRFKTKDPNIDKILNNHFFGVFMLHDKELISSDVEFEGVVIRLDGDGDGATLWQLSFTDMQGKDKRKGGSTSFVIIVPKDLSTFNDQLELDPTLMIDILRTRSPEFDRSNKALTLKYPKALRWVPSIGAKASNSGLGHVVEHQ
ncbi:MAG: hypothetical protein Q7T41_00140 [Candidatus Saccharibacteria bacterium]|nr:hypothetical protein [Candidatus Saccharibacteria bacterium]